MTMKEASENFCLICLPTSICVPAMSSANVWKYKESKLAVLAAQT